MFWKKGQAPPSNGKKSSERPVASEAEIVESPIASEPPPTDQTIEAVETLAEVLRSMGRHAFDLDDLSSEDTKEEFEKWALRLLVGEAGASGGSPGSNRQRGIKRDWGGVRRFTEKHRKEEHDYVVTGMANLRQAVRVFIQCTTGGFRAERQSEALVAEELDSLGKALAINDHAEIRAAAEKTAATVRNQAEQRKSREQKQIELLQDSMEKLRHELVQMRRAAKTDALTRLFNRAALDEHIVQVADQTFLSNTEACVVMVDIDHFKGINDNYGHQTGDEVLRQLAEALVRGFFRREDFVSRYGGEEFCIVAQHTTFDTTRERAERLRQNVEKLAISAFGKSLKVSISLGIASLQRGESAQSWLKRADEALYRAKQKGRNRFSVAPPSEGDALGGTGKPLGASLSVRPGDSPRIVHARASDQPAAPTAQPSSKPRPSAAPAGQAANENAAPNSGRKRQKGPTRPLGSSRKTTNSEAPAGKSPIAALLGPTSRR